MRSRIIIVLISISIIACKQKSEELKSLKLRSPIEEKKESSLIIAGSETMRPIMELSIPIFEAKNKTKINYLGGGSNVGLVALFQKETDVAVSSRPLDEDEMKGEKIIQKAIALDGLSIITNTNNPISKLTTEQIAKIYEGQITNWKELGGKNIKIIVYSRNISSGTYSFFKKHVLNGESYSREDIKLADNYQVINEVMENPGAIGYVGFAYNLKKVKPIEVSIDKGKQYVFPDIQNILSNNYPLARPLYFIYHEADSTKINKYLDYLLSAEGQNLILQSGFIPLKH
jgi:phosphate transport system substrate-binding protein